MGTVCRRLCSKFITSWHNMNTSKSSAPDMNVVSPIHVKIVESMHQADH